MKLQITKKLFSNLSDERIYLHTATITFIFFLISIAGCQKDASQVDANTSTIIYTDIIPDTIVTTERTMPIYNLDLDDDGVNDFTFECSYYRTQCRATGGFGFKSYTGVKPVDNSFNEVLNVSIDTAVSYTYPAALDTLNEIGSVSGEWSPASLQFLRDISYCGGIGGHLSEYGNWPDSNDKYLGLKLIKNSQVFYGWVRLNIHITLGNVVILKDYAYNSSPNEFILAGQKE